MPLIVSLLGATSASEVSNLAKIVRRALQIHSKVTPPQAGAGKVGESLATILAGKVLWVQKGLVCVSARKSFNFFTSCDLFVKVLFQKINTGINFSIIYK